MNANQTAHIAVPGTRIEYPDAAHVLIPLESLRIYAQGKAPWVGVPVVTDGSRCAAIFKRTVLQAALGAPGHVRALYDGETHTLTINGGRSHYTLIDQATLPVGKYFYMDALRKWAHGQQKGKVARERNATAGPMAPKARATRKQIEVLERRLGLVPLGEQPMPSVYNKDEDTCGGDYYRTHWQEFTAERTLRRTLSLFAAGGKCKDGRTWAQFYAVLAEILGRPISNGYQYSALKNRRHHEITWDQYWKRLPKYCGLVERPDTKWGRPQSDEEHWLHVRKEYAGALRAVREIEGQIKGLGELLAVYEWGLPAVESTADESETMEVEL